MKTESGSSADDVPVQMMYLAARKFGFQTFNPAAGNQEWIPATAFLAADHLGHLLVTDALPREGVPMLLMCCVP